MLPELPLSLPEYAQKPVPYTHFTGCFMPSRGPNDRFTPPTEIKRIIAAVKCLWHRVLRPGWQPGWAGNFPMLAPGIPRTASLDVVLTPGEFGGGRRQDLDFRHHTLANVLGNRRHKLGA